ncbi:MAG: hypothetical protein PSX71_01575 [bacterium]|nr:hypothetical protein [bacterium]
MNVFHLPDTGETPAEVRLVQWHVGAGDEVRAGQRLASIKTATVLVDISSPQSGHISALLAAEGEALAPQAPLLEFSGAAATGQNGAEAPQGFSIGRHRHTEARLQQSTQRRRARSNSKPSP